MADYLEAFSRESEEQITELNNALLEFEDDPTDEAAMEGIFRTAHTLKGNCGAMGFEPAEDLAHAIEDLLEAIRSNRVAVTPELMDAIFDGVDELDAMISEAVERGEIDREADAEIAILREYATTDGLAEPTDAEIENLLDSVSAPSDSEYSVYHVRLDVAGDPAVHGRAVVDALDDAFELLGTDPDGDAIDAGDYDGTIDAAFASVVQRAAVEAALEPVDAVADQRISDVTDRVPSDETGDVSEETAEQDATEDQSDDEVDDLSDLSVDELLEDEDVDQFDDLDEMAEDVGDTSEFEDLGDAGSFADLGLTEDDVEVGADDAGATTVESDADESAEPADASAGDAATDEGASGDDGEVEDAAAEFAQLKEEVDPVGFDELQDELADLEFDEYDSDDEVGFDELLDEDELEDDGAFAESAVTAAAADDAAADDAVESDDADEDDGASVPEAQAASGAAADGADATDAPDATAEDLFGGADDEASEEADETASVDTDEPVSVDANEPASMDEDEPASADADESDSAEEPASVEVEESASADAGTAVDADDSTAVDADDGTGADADDGTGPDAGDGAETSAGDAAAATATDEAAEFDASEVLDAESLDESAQSFGEGGLDLSEESTEADAATAQEVPEGAEDLDLDDSFGDIEAEASDDSTTETDAPSEEDAFDLGDETLPLDEDEIDFDEGTVAAPEDDAEATEEGVAVGSALEDDSFDPDIDAEDLSTEADANDDVESVEGFGDDDGVLDLDSGTVAGNVVPEDEEESLDATDVGEVDEDASLADADAGFEDADAAIDDADSAVEDANTAVDGPESGSAQTGDDAGALEDPGFSDGPASAEDDRPEIDEERLERIRTLGVPQRDADADTRSAATQSIRVDVESLDRMLNMVEGLVTSRARLRRALIENEPREVLEDELDDLEDVTSELQDTVMDVRLVPLRTAVNKLPRIVRDVAREEDKQVDFEMVGEDVELDRSILDEIGDPLVHLVRNAVDHGVETPDVREEADKSAEGSVELRATRERDRVTIVVEDDGAGIDADAVRDAAVEEGIHTRSEVDSMDDEDVHELIFHSGFSTASEVTDVSGRGVGMDVVAETVDRLDGSVSVESEPGEGTTITMELPVTLAIAEVLFVDVGGEEYGIPIKTVDEIGPVVDVETQDGQEVLVSDGGEDRRELIRLDEALSTPNRSDPNSGMLVHLRDDVREAAIHCDQVREQQEVVVKPFEGVLGDVPGLSGASVLGDGDVVTILDVETL